MKGVTQEIAKTVGYRMAFTTIPGVNYYGDSPMEIKRIVASQKDTGHQLIRKINKYSGQENELPLKHFENHPRKLQIFRFIYEGYLMYLKKLFLLVSRSCLL